PLDGVLPADRWPQRLGGHAAFSCRAEGARLSARLARHGLPNASTPLFAWVPTPDAAALHAALARQGLWTRLFDVPGTPPVQGLRLGLPPDAFGWQRLDDALASLPLSAETTSR
ncbi:hypothetical protein ACQCR9_24235, partial [Ralstonia pseudosolanacearum]